MDKRGNMQLKAALSALCQILPGSAWNPETFRRAKFNRPEACPEFWKLLHCVFTQIYERNENKIVENQVMYVKSVLRNQGYGRSAFYNLPCDGTEGSRELLLAFSWLLDKLNLLERLLEVNRVKLGDEIKCQRELSPKENGDVFSSDKQQIHIRYLVWLNGKLQLCWRTLHGAHQEKCALLNKIHSYTRGCHVDQNIKHFSFVETDLVQQPESSIKLLELLECENSLLQTYLEWKQVEPVYWKWMESVLESVCEDEQMLSDQKNKNHFFPSVLYHNANICSIDIDTLISCTTELGNQLQELVFLMESAWHGKVKVLENKHSCKELHVTGKKIKIEACKKTKDLKLQHRYITKIHSILRLFFKDSFEIKKGVVPNDPGIIFAAELIAQIQRAEAELKAEFQMLLEECQHRLDSIMDQFDGIICMAHAKKK
ncbi:tubulin epsilon and delta complex protein 1 isoform X2 [Spea bombifrons]|uniref:tubulin epsilon and delta complex protein 1 isoform X2 n=1 Tax=Spea bombifrons TaxID=233779 RepID=UPI00234BB36E|nr:tubulin epsilon and delta complex protein 1 isoform X2 [Spea bombifrons]